MTDDEVIEQALRNSEGDKVLQAMIRSLTGETRVKYAATLREVYEQ